MKRPIVLLAAELGGIGGMQRFDRLLARAMDAYCVAHALRLVVLALNDPLDSPSHPEIGDLRATRILRCAGNRVRFSLAALASFRKAGLVVYGLLGFAPLVFAQRVVAPRAPRYLLLHGIEAWQRRSGPYAAAMWQMTGTIAISRYTLDRFLQAYPVPQGQAGHVLPLSLSPGAAEDMQRGAPDGVEPPRLLSVARLSAQERYKGVDTVIRALPALLADFPTLQYVVVGDGSDRPRLEQLAQTLGVAPAVRFRGFVSDVEIRREYRECTIFVMPSGGEGFGLVFVEAMAHAKPVVAARAGGAPEVVADGTTGLLVEYGDVRSLTEGLLCLLRDPALCRRLGAAGLARARAEYAYHIFSARTAGLLDRALAG